MPRTLLAVIMILLSSVSLVPPAPAQQAQPVDRTEAYYRFSLGHLYQQMAMQYMRQEYVDRAIEEYRAAIAADPGAMYVREELIKLYAGSNRLDDAVAEANKVLADQPDNAAMHKLLGRIYRSYASDRQSGFNQDMLLSSIKAYERAIELDPKDFEALMEASSLYRAAGDRDGAQKALEKALELKPSDADALSSLASLYMESGETEKGLEALEKAMRSGDVDSRQLNMLARAYEQAGRFKDAADVYQRLLREAEGRNTLVIRRSLAQNLTMSGQLNEAREQYQELLDAEPRSPEHHLRMAQIDREQRRYSDAWEHLKAAQELDPDSLEIKYNTAMLLESERRFDEAIQAVEKILEETAQDSYSPRDQGNRLMFLEHLASLYRSSNNTQGALGVYDRILKLDSKSEPRVMMLRMETYRAARDHARAVEQAHEALDKFSDNRGVVLQCAIVLAENGEASAGAERVKSLLKGGPEDIDLYVTLGQIYEKGKMFDDAVEVLEKAQELAESEPARQSVLFSLASILERAKRFEESEEKFRSLLQKDPENSSALNYLGYMLADRGVKLDEAHDMIQKALDLDPDNGAYLDSLGWVYYRQDKLQLAERYLLRSLEQYETDPVVHTHLGDVYFKLGQAEDARRHWERGLEEWRKSAQADRDAVEMSKLEDKLKQLGVAVSNVEGGAAPEKKQR